MNQNNLKSMALEFEISLKIQGLADKTIKETLRKLGKFFDYLSSRGITHVDTITKEMVKTYQVELYQHINLKGQLNCIATQNKMLSAVKLFLSFLKDNDYIIEDPAGDIHYAKEPQKLPRSILTISEARKIMHSPDKKSVIGYRDRTILEVLYSSGIRKTELANLQVSDVDYNEGILRIEGKGKKERVVPIGKIACRYLENYISSVREELIKDPPNNYLFLSIRGKKLSKDVVRMSIKKYARGAGIKKNVHCHTFRHTCATHMLKNKANIRIIQELLGHTCLNSTQIYTHITITDLKEVHRRCHPREQDRE